MHARARVLAAPVSGASRQGRPRGAPSSWMSASALVCCWISFFTRSSSASAFCRSAAIAARCAGSSRAVKSVDSAVDAALQRLGEDLRARQRVLRRPGPWPATRPRPSAPAAVAVAGAAGRGPCRGAGAPGLPACGRWGAGRGVAGGRWPGRPARRGQGSRLAAGEPQRLRLQLVVRVGLAGRLHGLAPFGLLVARRRPATGRTHPPPTSTRRAKVRTRILLLFRLRPPRTAITERRPGVSAGAAHLAPDAEANAGAPRGRPAPPPIPARGGCLGRPRRRPAARSHRRPGSSGCRASATGGPPSRSGSASFSAGSSPTQTTA